ncbi:MAG: hypothetical protein Q8K85_01615 [Hyphomicrobium sp.]|nr:hypothetical protein [Hyphomicrobium sp.]
MIACASLVLAGCGTEAQPAALSTCEALRPDMPVQYHGRTTDAETVANIRRANARYQKVCPAAR